MKKLLALMLAVVLALSLTACGSSSQGQESNSPSNPSQAADNTPEPATPPLPPLNNLKNPGHLEITVSKYTILSCPRITVMLRQLL